MSEMCCTQLAKNTGRKNYASAHHCTTLLGYIFVPQTAQNGSGVWGTPATPTSLSAGQPNFARCLAISWAGTLYRYIFWGLLSRSNFARCKIHCVHILGSPILAALLHGTQPLGISQTLWRSAEGATYIRQGGHHIGHWPTFQSYFEGPLPIFSEGKNHQEPFINTAKQGTASKLKTTFQGQKSPRYC